MLTHTSLSIYNQTTCGIYKLLIIIIILILIIITIIIIIIITLFKCQVYLALYVLTGDTVNRETNVTNSSQPIETPDRGCGEILNFWTS